SVASIKDYSKNLRALWKSGTSPAPNFVSFVLSEEKQATNSCDCKRSMLDLTQWCRTTDTTAHFVSWCQGSKEVILKIVRTPSPTVNCALERGRSCGRPTFRPVPRTQNINGRCLSAEG